MISNGLSWAKSILLVAVPRIHDQLRTAPGAEWKDSAASGVRVVIVDDVCTTEASTIAAIETYMEPGDWPTVDGWGPTVLVEPLAGTPASRDSGEIVKR